MNFKNIKRKLVVFKYTLNRGYAWCQLPAMATMGAGVIFPYVKQYFDWIKFWELAVFAIVTFIFVGWIDKKLKLLHEEQNYVTETNPLLMEGLKGTLRDKNQDNKNQDNSIQPIQPKSI